MPIDFSKLPTLIGPRRKMILAERDNRERLARAHMKRAKGPKNHATNKERSHLARAKAERSEKAAAEHKARQEAFNEQVRAYWRGERDSHPGAERT